ITPPLHRGGVSSWQKWRFFYVIPPSAHCINHASFSTLKNNHPAPTCASISNDLLKLFNLSPPCLQRMSKK
ncbi:hypothetical protein, partial [Comamonas aquatica]